MLVMAKNEFMRRVKDVHPVGSLAAEYRIPESSSLHGAAQHTGRVARLLATVTSARILPLGINIEALLVLHTRSACFSNTPNELDK